MILVILLFFRNEVSRILLLLILELPPSRQTESHTNLIEKCITIPPDVHFAGELGLSKELFLCVCELVLVCNKKKISEAEGILDRLFQFKSLETEHYVLLEELNKKVNQ